MKTVTACFGETHEATAWWRRYLTDTIMDYVEQVVPNPQDEPFTWPTPPPGYANHAPESHREDDPTSDFVRGQLTSCIMEDREIADLTYDGHTQAERDRARRKRDEELREEEKRSDRVVVCPDLPKSTFVFVRVKKSSNELDKCVYDLGEVVDDWHAADHKLNPWLGRVRIRWWYRQTPNRYDSTFYPAVHRSGELRNKVVVEPVCRQAIEVEGIQLLKGAGRNKTRGLMKSSWDSILKALKGQLCRRDDGAIEYIGSPDVPGRFRVAVMRRTKPLLRRLWSRTLLVANSGPTPAVVMAATISCCSNYGRLE
jgi:hypothetical protein